MSTRGFFNNNGGTVSTVEVGTTGRGDGEGGLRKVREGRIGCFTLAFGLMARETDNAVANASFKRTRELLYRGTGWYDKCH